MSTLAAQPQAQAPLSKPVIFGSACIGGVLGWTVIHPFNTIAVRMNLASMQASTTGAKGSTSFVSYTSNMIRTEGIRAAYAGLGAGCLRQVFYATSRYGLFETFRDVAAQYRKTDFAQRFTIASVAGGCAALISCPIEVCLVRMSNDPTLAPELRRNYKSVFDAFGRIMNEEGVATFWRGSQPFVMRAMVVGGTQVATYDQFKGFFASAGLSASGIANQFCSAFSAGLIYSLITMPLETAKNRMAFQKPDPVSGKLPYAGTFQTISAVARADGALALWNGFIPYYGRCGGHTVTMFILVDQVRNMYRRTILGEKPPAQ